MKEFFSSLPVIHQNVSGGYVQALVQIHRQELFTGMMSMSYPSDQVLALLFWEGQPLNLYRCLKDRSENIPRQDWSAELDRPNAAVSQLSLALDELRLIRVLFESVVEGADRALLASPDLMIRLKDWAMLEEESLVWVSSGRGSTLGLVGGFGDPSFECTDLVDGSAHFARRNTEGADFPAGSDYEVVRYACRNRQKAWREHKLRLAFNPFMQLLVSRFGELAGRILAERLCRQLSNWCEDGGWKISIGGNGVANRHFFESLEQAVGVYVGLVRRFQDESSLAIGPRLAENLLREALTRLSAHPRALMVEHIYSRYGLSDLVLQP